MEICLVAAAYFHRSPRWWGISLDDDIRKPIKNMYAKVVIALATKDRIKAKSGDWPVNCWFNVFCESVLYTVQKRTVHFSVYLYLHYWIKIPDTFYVPGVNRSIPGSGLNPKHTKQMTNHLATWRDIEPILNLYLHNFKDDRFRNETTTVAYEPMKWSHINENTI